MSRTFAAAAAAPTHSAHTPDRRSREGHQAPTNQTAREACGAPCLHRSGGARTAHASERLARSIAGAHRSEEGARAYRAIRRRPRATTNAVNSVCRAAGLCPSVNSKFFNFSVVCFCLCFGLSVADCCERVSPVCRVDDRSTEQDLRNVNDPSAGSPTETLLRLLLPLNDQVWSSSRQHRQCRDIAAHQSEDLTKSFNR